MQSKIEEGFKKKKESIDVSSNAAPRFKLKILCIYVTSAIISKCIRKCLQHRLLSAKCNLWVCWSIVCDKTQKPNFNFFIAVIMYI